MVCLDREIISDLYSTTSSEYKWGSILDRLHPIVGAKAAGLIVVDKYSVDRPAPNQFGIASKSLDSEKLSFYNKEFAKYEHEIIKLGTDAPRWKMIVDPAFDDIDLISKRPDVAYAIKNFGIRDRFGIWLNNDPAWQDVIAFQFDIARGNATAEEYSRITPYIPHIAQSISIGRMYDEIRRKCGAVLSILDRVDVGMLLLTEDGTVLLSNQCALEIIDSNPRLNISHNKRLIAANNNSKLLEEIDLVAKSRYKADKIPKRYLSLGNDIDNDNLLIELSPLVDKHSELDSTLFGVIALVINPNSEFKLNKEGARVVFSLTPAELEVAKHVSEGCSYTDIAERRNSSTQTVKKQIRSIFSKTNSSSRAGIVRRMLSISLPFRD